MAGKWFSLIGFLTAFALCASSLASAADLQELPSEPRGRVPPHQHAKDTSVDLPVQLQDTAKEPRSSHVTLPCTQSPSPHVMSGGDTVAFTSPRYPRRYRKNTDCGWNLQGSDDRVSIMLDCDTFNVERKRKRRCGDFLRLNSIKYCGRYRNGFYGWQSSGSSLVAHFHSNRKRNKKGFSCIARAYSSETTTMTSRTSSTTTASTTTTTPASTTTSTPPTTTTNTLSTSTTTVSNNICGVPNRSTRIVGGVATEENEYPWQVAIADAGSDDYQDFFCGGSIINERWVLSAAHCEITTSHQVIVGAHNWDSPPSSKRRVNIESVMDHVSYNSDTVDNDISLVKLAEDLDFNDIGLAPVCLPTSGSADTFTGDKATVTGWGKTASGGNYPSKLLEVEVDVVSNAACTGDYGSGEITDNMLCAGLDAGGKDSCQGDSGGPLTKESSSVYTQIGVVSWGIGCGGADHYGVYARVTRYDDWIKNNIGSYSIYHAP